MQEIPNNTFIVIKLHPTITQIKESKRNNGSHKRRLSSETVSIFLVRAATSNMFLQIFNTIVSEQRQIFSSLVDSKDRDHQPCQNILL